MKEPGRILLWVAHRLCSPRSVERVVLPALLDQRLECAAAVAAGKWWRAGWIRLTGSARIAQAMVLQRAIDVWRGPAHTAERRELAVAELVIFTALVFVVSSVLAWLAVGTRGLSERFSLADRVRIFMYMLPALTTSFLPASLLPGVLLALRRAGGPPTPRDRTRVLKVSSLVAAVVFALGAWVLPLANRQVVSITKAALGIKEPHVPGTRELTIGELNRKVAELEAWPWATTGYRVERHKKFAVPLGALVFPLLALGLARRGVARTVVACLLVPMPVLAGYFFLLRVGEQAAVELAIPAMLGAWLGNATLALVALAAFVRGPRASSTTPASA
jgi:lipopolysaccharide export LptBFGC system permease protein LptF